MRSEEVSAPNRIFRGWTRVRDQLRGWANLCRMPLPYILYRVRNRLRGLDLKPVRLEGWLWSNERSIMYLDSGGPDLEYVLSKIPIPKGSVALDLGSGKAGSTISLAKFPFEKVIGVELSREHIEVAQRNVARAKVQRVEFICVDAGMFRDLEEITHIYFFNAFPPVVLEEFLSNLAASLKVAPRSVVFISRYPATHDVVVKSGIFEDHRTIEVPFPTMEHRVYFRRNLGVE